MGEGKDLRRVVWAERWGDGVEGWESQGSQREDKGAQES